MADSINILLSRFRFLSASEKRLLRDIAGSLDVLTSMSIEDIQAVTGRKYRIKDYSLKKALNEAEKAEKILASGSIKCLFLDEKDYPAQLAEIYDPPFMLYYRGSLPEWDKPAAAVVGTRLASGRGLDAAFELGFDFARCGMPVVSGLAMGVDSAAHSGAVAARGRTIAVLGGGPDRIYPAANKKIAASILENEGTVLSEYLPGETPQKHHFPERNRIISGLSRAVVVVEAPGKSGALITADFALEQGRDLFIHNTGLKSIGAQSGRGRLERMIFDGAPIISGAAEVLDDWGLSSDPIKTGSMNLEIAMSTQKAGGLMAARMRDELKGYNIKFNGKYFRRGCYESSYSINS